MPGDHCVGERDAVLPVELYGRNARERLPQATFEILPEVAAANIDPAAITAGIHCHRV